MKINMPRKKIIVTPGAVEDKKLELRVKKRKPECVKKAKVITATKTCRRKVNRHVLNAIGPSIVKVRCKIPGKENTITEKTSQPYSEEKLKECLNAIMKKEITQTRAIEIYNIPKSTICQKLKDLKKPVLRVAKNLKRDRSYSEDNLEECLKAIIKKEITQKYACDHYNIPRSTIYKRLKALKEAGVMPILKGDEDYTSLQNRSNSGNSPEKREQPPIHEDDTDMMHTPKCKHKLGTKSSKPENNYQVHQREDGKLKSRREKGNQQEVGRNPDKNFDQKEKKKVLPKNKLGFKIKIVRKKVKNKKQGKPKLKKTQEAGEVNLYKLESATLKKGSPKKCTQQEQQKKITPSKSKVKNPEDKVIKDAGQSNDTTEMKGVDTSLVDVYDTPNVAKDLNQNIKQVKQKKYMPSKILTRKTETDRRGCKGADKNPIVLVQKMVVDRNLHSEHKFVYKAVEKVSICGNQGAEPKARETSSRCGENIEHNGTNSSVLSDSISTEDGTDPPNADMSWLNDISSNSESLVTASEKLVSTMNGEVATVELTDCMTYKDHDDHFLSSIGLKPSPKNLESTSTSVVSEHRSCQEDIYEDFQRRQAELSSSTSCTNSSSSSSTTSSNVSDSPTEPAQAAAYPQGEQKIQEKMRNIERLRNILANFDLSSWVEQLRKIESHLLNETLKMDEKMVHSFVSEIPLLSEYKPLLKNEQESIFKTPTVEGKSDPTSPTSHLTKSHNFSKPQPKMKCIPSNRASPFASNLTLPQQHNVGQKDCTNTHSVKSLINKSAEADDDDEVLSLYADSISFNESFPRFADTPSTTSCNSLHNQNVDQIDRIDSNRKRTSNSCHKTPITFEENREFMDSINSREETAECSAQSHSLSPELAGDVSSESIVNNVNGQLHDYTQYVLSLTPHTDKGKLLSGVCFFYQISCCWNRRCTYPHRLLTAADIQCRLSSYDPSRVIHEYLCIKKHKELYLKFSSIFYDVFEDKKCLVGIELLAYDNCCPYSNPLMVSACLRLLSESEYWQPSALMGTSGGTERSLADVLLQVAVRDMYEGHGNHFRAVFKLSAYLQTINRKVETSTAEQILNLATSINVKDENFLQNVYRNVVLNSRIMSEQFPNPFVRRLEQLLSEPKQGIPQLMFNEPVEANKRFKPTALMDVPAVYATRDQNEIQTKNISPTYQSVRDVAPNTRASEAQVVPKERINPWETNMSTFQMPGARSPNFAATPGGLNVTRPVPSTHRNFVWQQIPAGAGFNIPPSISPQNTIRQAAPNIGGIASPQYPQIFQQTVWSERQQQRFAASGQNRYNADRKMQRANFVPLQQKRKHNFC